MPSRLNSLNGIVEVPPAVHSGVRKQGEKKMKVCVIVMVRSGLKNYLPVIESNFSIGRDVCPKGRRSDLCGLRINASIQVN